ncbi:hypothetical protein ACFE04_031087 [Oxalis oulophora]
MGNQETDNSSDQNPDTRIVDLTDSLPEKHSTPKTLTLGSSSDFPLQVISLDNEDKDDIEAENQDDHNRTRVHVKEFEVFLRNFKPIPFVPAKILDFDRYESLLKRLGLWSFVHMKFDASVRKDLVAQVIASFNPSMHCSYVNGARIMVSCADLARALSLPVKKIRVDASEDVDVIGGDDKLKRFIDDFVSTWVLLHNDTWMMPKEIMNWTNLIREGKLEKVDWAGLLWFMVEQELKDSDGEFVLGNCYYASHMQCLIKDQQEELLMEDETQIEADVIDEYDGVEMDSEDATMDIEEEILNDMQIETSDMETDPEMLEEYSVESSQGGMENADGDFLEKENMEDNALVVDDSEVEEDPDEEHEEDKHWLVLEKKNRGDTFCGMTSANPNSLIEDVHIPSGSPSLQIHANKLPLYGNNNKRPIDHGNDLSHVCSKRPRTYSPPMINNPANSLQMLDQAQYLTGKARNLLAEKEHGLLLANMYQQYLHDELKVRDRMIEQLQKETVEEQNKTQMEVHRLDNQLSTMSKVLEGYRNALKETQRKFSEYRERCLMPVKSLYKDVPGSEGLVLSTMELEKQKMKQKEEKRKSRSLVEKKEERK